jgi:hypothetical protein
MGRALPSTGSSARDQEERQMMMQAVSRLRFEDGLEGPRSGYRIGVTMGDLPPVGFPAPYGRGAKGERPALLGVTDLDSGTTLDLEDVRQVAYSEIRSTRWACPSRT